MKRSPRIDHATPHRSSIPITDVDRQSPLRTEQGNYVLAYTGAGYLSLVASGLVLGIGCGRQRRPVEVVTLAPAGSD